MNPPADTSAARRVPELDGLRGVAILLVVFYHCVFGAVTPAWGRAGKIMLAAGPLSWSGVDLFFVLSGYLLGGILLDQRGSANYFRVFYVRRICRIFPLYFLWLGLFVVVWWSLSADARAGWFNTVFGQDLSALHYGSYFVFLQNVWMAQRSAFGSAWFAATWSLAVEEQFYLVLPLLIWLVPPRKLPGVLLLLVAFAPVFRLYLYLQHPSVFAYVLLPCRADALLLGVLGAYLVRQERWRRCWEEHADWRGLGLILLLAGVGYLAYFASGQDDYALVTSFEMVSYGYTVLAVFYLFLLLVVVTRPAGFLARVMRWSWLRFCGTVAYGVFLMHMAINGLAHGLLCGSRQPLIRRPVEALVTLGAIALTFVVASISWRRWEKPIVAWGHSFVYTK